MPSILDPIPNSPFYSPASYNVSTPLGSLILGSGLSVTPSGVIVAASALGGTLTSVTAGPGLSTNGSTSGGSITVAGILTLLPPQGSSIGGVKAGANVVIAADGTISVAAPGNGTISSVTVGSGLTGGGVGPNVPIGLAVASTTQFGGVIVDPVGGINVVGAQISVAQATTTTKGGVTLATSAEVIAGVDNTKAITAAGLAAKVASPLVPGIVQLSNSVSLTSSFYAATSTAVKTAYDAAIVAQTTANASLPKAGGTMTGVITFAPTQTFPGVAFPVATANSLGVVSAGPGLSVNSSGVLSTLNNGTVTAVTAGPGLGAPATGNTISTSGTLRLVPPTGTSLGGVKAGANINIAFDGTISVPANAFMAVNNPFSYNGYQWPIPLAAPSLPFPGVNGQVLTVLDNLTGEIGWTNAGTLQSVVAGPGITVTSTPTSATVYLTTVSSITPGSFGSTAIIPTFSVNAQGQITSTGSANTYPPFQIATVSAPPFLVLDFTDNNTNWEYTLNGNLTLSNPINVQPGMRGGMLLRQDPFSPFALSWGTSWKFANNTPATISPVASAVDYFEFVVISSNYIIVTLYLPGIG
jgi:hypothetical protein